MIGARIAKMTGRERGGVLLAIACAAAFVLDLLVVHPILRESKQLGEQISSLEKQLLNCRSVVLTRPHWEKEYAAVGGVLKSAHSQLEEIANMKGEVDELARKTGILVSSMEHKEPRSNKEYYDEYFVELGKFDADRGAFLAFLDELQKSPSLLRVSRLSITPATTADRIKGSITISKVMLAVGRTGTNAPSAAAQTQGNVR
jgi:hypothetical protein